MGTRSHPPAEAWDYPPGFVLKIIIIIIRQDVQKLVNMIGIVAYRRTYRSIHDSVWSTVVGLQQRHFLLVQSFSSAFI